VEDIPTKKAAKYLAMWLNDKHLEESRIARSLFARANSLFQQDNHTLVCSDKSKKLLANSYGSINGIKALSKVSTKIANAHRYLVKNIFMERRQFADLSDYNGWIDIRSRTLYVVFDIYSVGENYRILTNNLIIRSRGANNILIQKILETLRLDDTGTNVVNGNSIIEQKTLISIAKCRAYYSI